MSIFGKIKDAIFGKKTQTTPTPQTRQPAPGTNTQPRTTTARTPAKPARDETIGVVDVENNLDSMPGADRLNWRTSIVDLMKLIGVDSDYESRKALANEMGRNDYSGSSEDNIWLHRRVMNELATNGGKVPPELRD